MANPENIFGLVALLISILSAIIAIATFLLPDPAKYKGIRFVLGTIFLIFTFILGIVAISGMASPIIQIPFVARTATSFSTPQTTVVPLATSPKSAPTAWASATTVPQSAVPILPTDTPDLNPSSLQEKLHLAFMANNASNDLLISSSPDGVSWPENKRLGVGSKGAPSLVRFGQKLYVAYLANTETEFSDLLITSSDDGLKWGGVSSVREQQSRVAPALAIFNDNLYLVYNSVVPTDSIAVMSSPDGETWSAPISLGISTLDPVATTVFHGVLYIAFVESDGSREVKLTSSSDGINWSAPVAVGVISKFGVAMSEFNGMLYAAFIANNEYNQIMLISSPDGATWSNDLQVRTETSAMMPSICKFAGKLYIGYVANDSTRDIMILSSSDGKTWPGLVRIRAEHSQSSVSLAS